MKTSEGYCVRCKKTVSIQKPEKVTMKNGRPALRGKCPDCWTSIYRLLPKEK